MVAAIPTVLLLALLPSTPITWSGAGYLAAVVLLVVALLTLPLRRPRWLGRLALLMIVGLQIAVPRQEPSLTAHTGPAGRGARWVSRLFDEQDIVLFGERVAAHLGLVSTQEDAGLIDALTQGYATMRAAGATTAAPFLHTALGQQQPERFDMLTAEPLSAAPTRAAVIFLHGYGGNFALQC